MEATMWKTEELEATIKEITGSTREIEFPYDERKEDGSLDELQSSLNYHYGLQEIVTFLKSKK